MEALLPYLLDFEKEIAQTKDVERVKAFWLKVAWELENCDEAKEVFPDMRICPVCLGQEEEGRLSHKMLFELLN